MKTKDENILHNRARKLAQPDIIFSDSEKERLHFAKFSIGNDSYCIETHFIKEIISVKEITPLPGVPSLVKGIINVRGRIIAVFNSYNIFQIKNNKNITSGKVIIIGSLEHQKEFGILADTIEGTLDIALNEINPAPQNLSGLGAVYIRGISQEGTIIIDALPLITSNELVINQSI